jgi:mxaJ protein
MRLCFLSVVLAVAPLMAGPATLRVCADPNNLPYSNEKAAGFENRIAEVLAKTMNQKVEFVWWSERKGLVKNTLNEGRCDVLMGLPVGMDDADLTRPYFRSTYVFVTRKDRNLNLESLTDDRLEKLRIGIHVVGDDYAPPSFALARRGIVANVTGYSLFGEYGEPNPPAKLIHAVAAGDVDVAIVWGPFAGYFAPREKVGLEVTPVSPQAYMAVPFVYDIAMAVRKGNDKLRAALDDALVRNCAAVQGVLHEFGVPQVAQAEGKGTCDESRGSPAASSR